MMPFLKEATMMDHRFKGKVKNEDVWERLKEAAVRGVSNDQNVTKCNFENVCNVYYKVYFHFECNNVHIATLIS